MDSMNPGSTILVVCCGLLRGDNKLIEQYCVVEEKPQPHEQKKGERKIVPCAS